MSTSKINNTIAIIGFSGTGKSKVAREVARRLGWEAVDTDDEIVALDGKSIPQIFEQDGEQRFRDLETRILKQVCQKEHTVIASGGGIILNSENRDMLLNTCTVICLEAEVETIYQRLLEDTSEPSIRPLLASEDPLQRIKQLKSERQPFYEIAGHMVHTDGLTLNDVAEEVLKGWQRLNPGTVEVMKHSGADRAFDVVTAGGRYPVYVGWGIVESLGEKLKQASLFGRAVIVSDTNVFASHGRPASSSLSEAGFTVLHHEVPPGEGSKTIEQATKIYDFLVEKHVERTDCIIALGGGMVGDLAGFVAATYLRGIPFIQVPTSLIGMADASIGGKVAVDHPQGKNLIGAFHQPRFVLSDVQTLTTLPQRELTSGWSEVIKHGMILDSQFVSFLEENAGALIALSPEITSRAIADSAKIKAKVVSEDEKESGKRMILNYGHTIAHGIEAAGNYMQLLHGEAVSVGMMGAALLSRNLGFVSPAVVDRQKQLLQRYDLPVDCKGICIDDVLDAIQLDKKVRQSAVNWILLENIGKVTIRNDVPYQEVTEVLKEVIRS